ncbi:MAG: four helix bundle protein [Stygiobacter sp.]
MNNWFVKEGTTSYSNSVLSKSFQFSIRVIKLYKLLTERDKSLYPIFKQFLKSGTSIGANINEAQSAPSKKDFINKLNISLKESKETKYWLDLLKESDMLSEKEFNSISSDCIELIKLLTSIIKTSKQNI